MNYPTSPAVIGLLLAINSIDGGLNFVYADVQYSMNVGINAAARNFLNNNQQYVAIAYASPLSERNTVVVSLAFAPDSSNISFDYGWTLYTSPNCPANDFDVINIAVTQENVGSERGYSFDGATIFSDGMGVNGYISLYYDASSESEPVSAGLAQYIYNTSQRPNNPAPINYHTLNPFETLSIPVFGSTIWIFVANNITEGSVIPINILRPVSDSASATSSNAGASSASQATIRQISRYLPVDLSNASQTTVHFDLEINAFAYGSYP